MKPMKKISYMMGTQYQNKIGGLLGMSIGDCLRDTTAKFPNNDALISYHQKQKWSYEELLSKSESFAKGLVDLGLEKGSRVGIYAPNCSEWVIAQFASALADIILVNINPSYQSYDLKHTLNKVGVKALIMTPSFKSSNYVQLLEAVSPDLKDNTSTTMNLANLPHLKHCIIIDHKKEDVKSLNKGFINFNDIYSKSSNSEYEERTRNVNFDDATNIQFTSGTTGAPKAATLSHHNILNNGRNVGALLDYTEKDKVVISVPLYHCFGMVMGNLACISHGATMVFPDYGFNAVNSMKVTEEEKCTSLYGVPTMMIDYVKEQKANKRDISSLRTGITAGALCLPSLMEDMINVLNLSHVTNCYGMTETSPVSMQLPMDASFQKRTTTVGMVHPYTEVKIIDEKGQIVPRGEVGEFCTRGYSVMKGYWEDDAANKKSIINNWMHTGDLAKMDDEGYVSIVGRSKDMIIRGGENVYPSEVEGFLVTHPSIEDASVFGLPHEKYGESVCSWIRLKPGSAELTKEEIINYCKGKIARYKVPDDIKIVEAFPLTVTGKIMKYKMKEEQINSMKK